MKIIKPIAEKFNFSAIPKEMACLPQWVVWKYQQRKYKNKKVPYNPRSGRPAKSNTPSSWATLEDALAVLRQDNYSGIGFMFASGFAGIDLDECRNSDTGEIKSWAAEVIKELDSYTEISPSGCGLHIFIKGKLSGGGINRIWNGHKIEIYDSLRFFTVTGEHLTGTPTKVCERQAEIESLYSRVVQGTGRRERKICSPKAYSMTDDAVMEVALNAKNGFKFERLWDGDSFGYPSASEADLAFVRILCFYSEDDEQVARLFRGSKRYRRKLERDDYIARTIAKARSGQTEYYTPPKGLRHVGGEVLGEPNSTADADGGDFPISKDPKREEYLRRLLANSSRVTRARMMMVAALGFKKLPWRLLNAIHAYQRNKLGVKIITDKRLQDLYGASGQPSSERTVQRDKEKLWKAQLEAGVELIWYRPGTMNPVTGEKFGSRYISWLDRWALLAIDEAITANGDNYSIRDEQLRVACEKVASGIGRDHKQAKSRKGGKDMIPEIIALERRIKAAGSRYKKLLSELQNKMADAGSTGGEIYLRIQEIKTEIGMIDQSSSKPS